MKKYLLFIFVAISFIMIQCSKDDQKDDIDAPLTVECGNLADVTTLTDRNPSGVDYIINCELRFDEGTLTIHPGTTIEFKENGYIFMAGISKIIANGTASEPIRMTNSGGALPDWSGIYYSSLGVGSALTNVIIEKAGGVRSHGIFNNRKAAVTVEQGSLSMSNVTIDKSGEIGIILFENTGITNMSNIKIANSGAFPFMTDIKNLPNLDLTQIAMQNNAKNMVAIQSPTANDNESNAVTTLQDIAVPYYFQNITYINEDFTIAPGVEMVMAKDAEIQVYSDGSDLAAIGNASNHIIIKGEEATSGYWGGILILGKSDRHRMEFVDISDGGSTTYDWGENKSNIKLAGYQTSTLTLNNITSTRSGQCDVAIHEAWATQTLVNNNASLSICTD